MRPQHQPADVILHVTRHRNRPHQAFHRNDLLGGDDRQRLGRLHARRAVENGQQVLKLRALHGDFEGKAVELRLRQRIRAFHFNRILRRQHEERLGHTVRLLGHRYRLLRHRLQAAPTASWVSPG